MERATVIIQHEDLRKVLNLPDDVEIAAITVSNDPIFLKVHLIGESLPLPDYARERTHRDSESWYLPLSEVVKKS